MRQALQFWYDYLEAEYEAADQTGRGLLMPLMDRLAILIQFASDTPLEEN